MPRMTRGAWTAAGLAVALVAAAPSLLSCTVNQVLSLSADGSGTLSTHAEVSPVLRDYLASLAQVSGADSPMSKGQVFDAAATRRDLQARPGLKVIRAAAPTPASLDVDLGFDSLTDALRGEGALADAGAVTLVDAGDRATLKLRLDRSTYGQLTALFPPLQDPVMRQLGPQGTGAVTESDYLDMIRFSIGDAAPGLLRKSFFTLTVHPAGEILSQSGGTVADGAVVFRIPVLRVLVLDRALEYSVTYRTGGS